MHAGVIMLNTVNKIDRAAAKPCNVSPLHLTLIDGSLLLLSSRHYSVFVSSHHSSVAQTPWRGNQRSASAAPEVSVQPS